ncbi:hypothetical protein VP01_4931g1 [Puccinia sorghi]|uniref:Uncharacterized protein n=1 Tax=Puccinia sorghi TaxID=27349 RepID=A0A0L6UM12_9BASI|nr:hypothetical protein VP01_4931g1 [Puccinia sorghi]
MAFQNNNDLENILPTSKPNTTGMFLGNQNMNIDQTASRISTVFLPPRATNHGRNHTYQGRLPNQGNNPATNQAQTCTTGTYRVPDEPEDIVEPRINSITGRRKFAIIKAWNLCYEGNNFHEFLDQFEQAADVYGAVGAHMVEIWRDSHARIQHTIKDIYNLVEETDLPKTCSELLSMRCAVIIHSAGAQQLIFDTNPIC